MTREAARLQLLGFVESEADGYSQLEPARVMDLQGASRFQSSPHPCSPMSNVGEAPLCPPTALSQLPTTLSRPPTTLSWPPTTLSQPPTAHVVPPAE